MGETPIRIPWARPRFWGREEAYVLEALRSTWISGGEFVDRLESDMTKLTGAAYATSASNGTAAIHMAYLALNLEPDDELIVPGFCFLAAANIALHMRVRPVFADVDPDTWCLDPAAIEAYITDRTKGVVAVHTYGNVCDLSRLKQICSQRGIHLIEDAAEALGSTFDGNQVGGTGTVGTFSFQATKTVTSGEGGMVVTSDPDIHERMLLYRNHGMNARRYWHEVPGHNFRLTNLQAALACAQLDNLDDISAERARVHDAYRQRLSDVDGLRMQTIPSEVEAIVWAVAVRVDLGVARRSRDDIIATLRAEGIETRPGFYSPLAMDLYGHQSDLPVATKLSNEILSLPTFAGLAEEEIDEICTRLGEAIRG